MPEPVLSDECTVRSWISPVRRFTVSILVTRRAARTGYLRRDSIRVCGEGWGAPLMRHLIQEEIAESAEAKLLSESE
ncbi:hypothetical protein GCM10010305_51290 [Streptomyces termitum]|uniref:Uncharacterized protein n=1 Tax=Streptomyces termitum TaxID=67368 RepID=A0A918T7C9_9ACTN|nr:hypothetical protein GCM10010305_51290 [Streptomyces termitum]